MVKQVFKKYLPARDDIEKHGRLHLFGDWIHDPNLWHLTRQSTAGGVANGLFWAFVPIPGQTILAIITAVFFRVNIPITVLFAWMTNPITIYPIFYVAYKTGSLILDLPVKAVNFEWSWHWFTTVLADIWLPLTVGCFLCGVLSAVLGYFTVRWMWRFNAVRKWQDRKQKNRLRQQSSSGV